MKLHLIELFRSAQMLRQQADRIAELEREVEHYKNKAAYLDKRELELLSGRHGAKHKHAELIKAWANGAEIEQGIKTADGKIYWTTPKLITWRESQVYRLKRVQLTRIQDE